MAMTKIKGLQMWCRKMTDGYPNVNIANFTTAWRDGLAFCAIIHRFRPDLIDFDSLSSENVLYNNKLAFEVAETELGIPAFLEADDMARLKVPDKLSVITYVSQYYNFLNALPQLGGPGVKGSGPKKTPTTSGVKRAPDSDMSQAPSSKKTVKSSISPTAEALKQEVGKNNIKSSPPKQTATGDKCTICQNKVYLLERHIEDGKLYHRSCFRHSDLSPTNRVFTRSPFMSPALSSERAEPENQAQKRPERPPTSLSNLNSRHAENIKGAKDMPMSKDSAKSNLSSVLKRAEGAGTKHSIEPTGREEESKKSRFQPKSLFEDTSPTTANKFSKEDTSKTTEQNDTESASVFPLSSKEARKLVKRRQQIFDNEKTPKSNSGTKRTMPLIFQQSNSQSSASPSNSSSSVSVSSNFTSASTKPSSSAAAVSSKKDTTNNKTELNAINLKSGVSENESVSQSGPRQQSAPSILSLQQKFSGGNNDTKSPVAKPRISTAKEAPSKSPTLETNNVLRSRENVPKPAPRKSFAETHSNKVPPERPKYSPRTKVSSSTESSSADEKSTPRSSSSASPPPLPTSPPPDLSQTQPSSSNQNLKTQSPHHPPPLPSSLPPSLPSKGYSGSNSPSSNSSSPVPVSSSHSSVLSSTSSDKPYKSAALSDSSALNKPSESHPISVSSSSQKEPPVAVLVTPTTKKDDSTVLSGLLTSLAGIRGRSASTPMVIEATSTVTPVSTTNALSSSTSSSSNTTSTSYSSRKHSEPVLKPAISVSTAIRHVTDSSVPKATGLNLNPVASTATPAKLTNTTVSSSQSKTVPEALSILSSLKPVSSSEASKSSISSSSSSSNAGGINEIPKARSQSDPKPHSNNKINRMAPEDPRKTSSSSDSKNNIPFLKDVHLKRVMPESKPKAGDGNLAGKAPAFSVNLKKVEPHSSDAEPKKSQDRIQPPEDKKSSDESGKDKIKDTKVAENSSTVEVPQWKRDIEERKRKMREDIARAESKTPSTYTKKERPKSADILSLVNDSKDDKLDPVSSIIESPRSDSSTSSVSSSSSSKRRSKSVVEVSSDSSGKLDWQLEAEKKIAAFALFDSSEDEGRSGAASSKAKVATKVPEKKGQSELEDSHMNVSQGKDTKSTHSPEPKVSESKTNLKSQDHVKHNLRKNNLTELKYQLKESEVITSKMELRTVDIDISGEGEMVKGHGDKDTVLHDSKGDRQAGVMLKEPLAVNANNNKNNNKRPVSPKIKSVQKLEESESTSDAPVASTTSHSVSPAITNNNDVNTRKAPAESTVIENNKMENDQEQEKADSPKLRRKITFLGRASSRTESPPPRRKIAVETAFDFDGNSVTSSDFEESLTRSTAEISIKGDQTPPQRPPRPKSQRSKSQSPQQISAIELQQQLLDIDNRLTDLELRGRDLEDSIRNVNTLEDDDEELMIQWFSLVREKNELVRQEADLVYLSREQDLEDAQERIDAQLRYLMGKEDSTKSPQEKQEESYLLQRKIDIVNQRSSIVDSMDEDRLRYEEEDRNIEDILLEKGLIRNARGSLMVKKGLKIAKSTFYT